MTRLSRFKLSARLSHLDLYPDAVRPLARDSCPDFPDLMTRLSRFKLSERLCNLGLNPNAARPLVRLMSRLSRPYSRLSQLKLSARICSLGLNPDATRPLARFLSRLFRLYDKTFKVETLGATLQFGSKSGCGATLDVVFVQTFQIL